MAFVIRYISRSAKKSYLSVKNTLVRKKGKNICNFKSVEAAQNYFQSLLSGVKNRKNLLQSHNANNFYVADFETDEKVAPLTLPQGKANRPIKLMPKSINKLTSILRNLQNNALIMDLEFFKDARKGHSTEQHIAQIAGLVLGKAKEQFDYYIFDQDRMNAKDQLAYLRKNSTIGYAEACKNNSQKIMKKVKNFLERRNIGTIISWGNATDFRVLDDDGFMDMFENMYAIDLEPIFAKANDNNAKMNLKAFCNLLNLSNKGIWHVALDDVKMIYQICELYMHVLNENALYNIALNSQTVPVGIAETKGDKQEQANKSTEKREPSHPVISRLPADDTHRKDRSQSKKFSDKELLKLFNYSVAHLNNLAITQLVNNFHHSFFSKTEMNKNDLESPQTCRAKKAKSQKKVNMMSSVNSRLLQEIFKQPDQFELLKR